MNIRLIKPGMSPPDGENKEPVEVPIIDTIQSWVSDFQSMKAKRMKLDFERISNPTKK